MHKTVKNGGRSSKNYEKKYSTKKVVPLQRRSAIQLRRNRQTQIPFLSALISKIVGIVLSKKTYFIVFTMFYTLMS